MPEPSGQPDVHDDEVGLVLARRSMASADGPGLGDDLEALAPLEQRDQALAHDLVVVHHQQPQGACIDLVGHSSP